MYIHFKLCWVKIEFENGKKKEDVKTLSLDTCEYKQKRKI